MHIICLTPLEAGVYNDHNSDNIAAPPEGWAYIPEGFSLPATFPRLGSIEAEEMPYTREVETEKEVTRERKEPVLDDNGNPVLDEEGNPFTNAVEYIEKVSVKEEQKYTMLTVTSMTEGTLPAPLPASTPSTEERVQALEETAAQQAEILNILLSGETEEQV